MNNLREYYKASSNNTTNQNKNICTMYVCDMFDVSENVRYLHTMKDVVRALRTKWTVRSRRSSFKAKTVSQFKDELRKKNVYGNFVIGVQGHVLAIINSEKHGIVIADTDSRKSDRRTITCIYVVY